MKFRMIPTYTAVDGTGVLFGVGAVFALFGRWCDL